MPIDFSKFQKKIPDKEISPDSQDEKITPRKNDQKVAYSSKKVPKSINESKNHSVDLGSESPRGEIDQKISEFELRIERKFNAFNERQLKLLGIGLQHELTIDNLIDYIKTHKKKTKLYKLIDFFKPAEPADIERMFKYLYHTKIIGRTQDNWYYLK